MAGCRLLLEIWNFFFPVGHASVAFITGFTLCTALIFWRTMIEVARGWVQKSSALRAFSLLIVLLTVSFFGLGPSEHEHYDTGLYYLNSIRWAHEYPVVPGLGNLHSRLAYNQSLFLFIAFLSSLVNMGMARACQIVNPLFVFISGWAILDRFKLNLSTAKEKRVRLYSLLLLIPLFFLGANINISAPTSDIAAAVFALPGALAFFSCLEEISERDTIKASNWLSLLTVCGCTIAKLKLSYSVLGGTAIGLA